MTEPDPALSCPALAAKVIRHLEHAAARAIRLGDAPRGTELVSAMSGCVIWRSGEPPARWVPWNFTRSASHDSFLESR